MLDRMKAAVGDFLNGAGWLPTGRTRFEENDVRLLVAVLLVHAVSIDGRVSARERKALQRVLSREYALDPNQTEALIGAAETREAEAVDLYGFTSQIRQRLNEDGRRRIVELLWEIALADGEAHEFEDSMIWRVSELLGISTRERQLLRKVIEARMAVG